MRMITTDFGQFREGQPVTVKTQVNKNGVTVTAEGKILGWIYPDRSSTCYLEIEGHGQIPVRTSLGHIAGWEEAIVTRSIPKMNIVSITPKTA